jgi:hypothetical protein
MKQILRDSYVQFALSNGYRKKDVVGIQYPYDEKYSENRIWLLIKDKK